MPVEVTDAQGIWESVERYKRTPELCLLKSSRPLLMPIEREVL